MTITPPNAGNPFPTEPAEQTKGRLSDVFRAFAKLGLISFGGPVAHLGYFHEEFVVKRQWLDDAAYGDLVALCQFLPGPASSQVVFALGMRRRGLPGALIASLCFMLPSAALMILFAYGLTALGNLHQAGWLHGLKLAAVAVVAQAVVKMGHKLCPDWARRALCLASAALVLSCPGAFGQIGAIVIGALAAWLIYRREIPNQAQSAAVNFRSHLASAACLAAFLGFLVILPTLVATTKPTALAMLDSFYRAGALVFGGGHVVLPLLRAEVVPRGWVSDDAFLAGYGAAQAIPGPLFTFSAYLGAVIHPGSRGWISGLWCLLAIYLPSWLILGAALPLWDVLRQKQWMQAALRGANAAVTGVLLAALYNPVGTQGVRSVLDAGMVLIAYAALELWKIPAWLVVVLAAVAGQIFLG